MLCWLQFLEARAAGEKAPEQVATIKMMKSIVPSPPPQSPPWLAASCQLPSLSMSHICHHPLLSFIMAASTSPC